MLDTEIAIETDRIKNLVANFGWEVEKQKIDDDEVTLTIIKKRSSLAKKAGNGAS